MQQNVKRSKSWRFSIYNTFYFTIIQRWSLVSKHVRFSISLSEPVCLFLPPKLYFLQLCIHSYINEAISLRLFIYKYVNKLYLHMTSIRMQVLVSIRMYMYKYAFAMVKSLVNSVTRNVSQWNRVTRIALTLLPLLYLAIHHSITQPTSNPDNCELENNLFHSRAQPTKSPSFQF